MDTYIPETLPPFDIAWEEHMPLAGQANRALAKCGGLIEGIVNPDILIAPLILEEAVLSSQIEGSQATMQGAMLFDINPDDPALMEPRSDLQEARNYREAILYAVEQMRTRPICINLICELHNILLDGVRGQDRGRGRIRRGQNHIGIPGTPIAQAIFVPPAPADVLPALNAWEKYIHVPERDVLVQMALVKAQFELIHPFVDGNGRVGRMLVPLFLYAKEAIDRPIFYVSAYLQAHRAEYYERLKAISRDRDWNGWINFFLSAVVGQSAIIIDKTQKISTLYDEIKDRVPQIIGSKYLIPAIDTLFKLPIFTIPKFIEISGIPSKSARNIINQLAGQGVVRILFESSGQRAARMVFPELLAILRP